MGQLVNGVWKDEWYDTESTGGKFVRSTAGFRNWITADGGPGPSGTGGFKAQSGRIMRDALRSYNHVVPVGHERQLGAVR